MNRQIHLPRPLVRLTTRLVQRGPQRTWIPVGLRRRSLEIAAKLIPLAEGTEVSAEELGGVPAERLVPPGGVEARAVLYLHGGAYVGGSPRTHRALASRLAAAAGSPVHVIDYRLAPEHPYPAAVEDALAAYRALLAAGLDPGRVALAGDSAGGGLALALALRLRELGEPQPAGIVLINGWFDLTCSGPSADRNRRRDAGLALKWTVASGEHYRAGRAPDLPELSPLAADLRDLPPLYMQAGGDDILLSDSERLVERARAAGVSVRYRRFEGMWHVFQGSAGTLREADEAVREIGGALRGFWGDVSALAPDGDAGASGNGGPRRSPRVVIVGAGFGGIGMGITLKRAGIDSFTILEKGDRIGGVWRDNTYPGAACDVPAHLYSFSFEPNPDWTRRYAPQEEILEYLERTVEHYGIGPHIRFGTEVARADFDAETGGWRIETTSGEKIEADVLISAPGQLSRPAPPRIEGLDRFDGPIFHSSRWDHSVELEGKRVAVIGTGASTIQIVPAIADRVGQLDVYQRSPPYVLPKKDRPYRGWEKRLFRRMPFARHIERFRIWLTFEVFVSAFNQFKRLGRLGVRLFERQLEEQVADPRLRQAVTPADVIGCKRVLISNDYYPTLARDDVELVTHGVRALTPAGIVSDDGSERPADVIVLSTGFASNDFLAPMEIHGLGGVELNEAWHRGAEAYLGISVAGFPNLFIMYGPNTNLGSGSIIYQLESQMNYILDAVRTLSRTGARYLTVQPDAQRQFAEEMQERLKDSVWMTGCNNWYVNEEGRNVNNWPGFTLEYRRRTRRLDLADYEMGNGTGSGDAQLSTRAE
jgi:cation diffusion facilitator CzcD-associated flavoprotein CzcO/acetyl esterase/lipase